LTQESVEERRREAVGGTDRQLMNPQEVLMSANAIFIDAETPSLRQVQLAGGPRLSYVDQGPGDAPVLVLLHGFTDSWFSFSRVLPLLAARYRVIALDQRGHGGSSFPDAPCSLDDMATDLVRLMSALDIPRAAIVGHCLGSFVARRIAALAPGRVTSLVLVGAGITPNNDPVSGLLPEVERLSDPVDPDFAREFQLGTVYAAVPEPFIERVIADSARVPARVWKEVLAGLLEYTASEADIQAPTLVLGGLCDSVFTVPEQEALARSIRGATLRLLPEIGHSPHWEHPMQFSLEVFDFLSRSGGPRRI
jgi:pimeloyl-ACP methyl ester carboxylesterase